ncbi:hypothetical protein [Meiothermus phage MMP17]|nr:hypothetical protein [Meiothermus phage MMP17]
MLPANRARSCQGSGSSPACWSRATGERARARSVAMSIYQHLCCRVGSLRVGAEGLDEPGAQGQPFRGGQHVDLHLGPLVVKLAQKASLKLEQPGEGMDSSDGIALFTICPGVGENAQGFTVEIAQALEDAAA